MKYLGFIILIFYACRPSAQESNAHEKQLDSIVSHFDKGLFFHGSVLAAKNGKVIFKKGYGWADASARIQNQEDQIFQIGSISKQFTAAAIMKLQEAGKLSVKDAVNTYFPTLKNGEKITVHHLLTHTSGLYNYTNDTAIWYGTLDEGKLLNVLNTRPADFEPGSGMRYCNSGYILAGYIIEKLSGKKYEQFIRDEFFKPLGMTSSGFDFEHLKSPKKSKGYYDNGSSNTEARFVDSTVSYAAGAIYSTVGDLYKWSQAMHENNILSRESWNTMTTAFKDDYGYGLVIDELSGEKKIWHNGGIDGFVSNMIYLPGQNIVVVALSNYMQSNVMELAKLMGLALLGKPYNLPEIRTEINLPVETLKEYIGRYELAPGFVIDITVDGNKLMAKATGQENFQVYAQKKDHFFYKVVDAQIGFERDSTGKVVSMTLYQNGMTPKGKKIQ